jgi:hypothetical protein
MHAGTPRWGLIAIVGALGLTACAQGVSSTSPVAKPTKAPDRQVLSVGQGPDLVTYWQQGAQLPSQISVADADKLLIRVSADQLRPSYGLAQAAEGPPPATPVEAPPADQIQAQQTMAAPPPAEKPIEAPMPVQQQAVAPAQDPVVTTPVTASTVTSLASVPGIMTGYSPFTMRLELLAQRFLPFGNYLYPYNLTGNVYSPYVSGGYSPFLYAYGNTLGSLGAYYWPYAYGGLGYGGLGLGWGGLGFSDIGFFGGRGFGFRGHGFHGGHIHR